MEKKNQIHHCFEKEVASIRESIGENPFDDLVNLVLNFLTMPHSNADVERLFL